MSSQKAFWKIDLKEVYRQIDLHKHSIKVTNFHRENDVYRFKRLCYHINKTSILCETLSANINLII